MLRVQDTTRSLLMAWAVFCGLPSATPVRAQMIDEMKATKVKAAYVYNFTRFVRWPEDAFEGDNAAFVIGVLGDDPFGRVIEDTVNAKTVAGRAIRVRRFQWYREEDRTAIRRCHVLYIGRSQRRWLRDIVGIVDGYPVLVVSDIDGSAAQGGMIGFVLEKNRIVFEINREALERARLRASAKLLALARIVESKTRLLPRSGKRRP